ncbi:MAG: S24/S26 family peptidase, partial [Lentisphaeria bacterium]
MVEKFHFGAKQWRKLVAAEVAKGRYLELKVVSSSMHPQIKIDDIVLIDILDGEPNTGEVVVYYNRGTGIPL